MPRTPRQMEEPGYRRLASHLREGIRAQRWAEGEPLPTDGQLGEDFGVSRQTVRRAYLDLVNEGLVYRVPGSGTFITPSHLRYRRTFETVDDLLGLADDTELEVIHPLVGGYEPEAAQHLGLDSRLMYAMRFVRRHQGIVFCHTSVFLPPTIGQLLEGDTAFSTPGSITTTTVIGALTARGVQLDGAEQLMTARAATGLDQERLGCSIGAPLLHVERLYVDASGTAVEWAVSDFLPEHYTHRLHLGRRRNTAPPTTAEGPSRKGTSS